MRRPTGLHEPQAGLLIQYDGSLSAVRMAQAHHQFGAAVMAGDDPGADDHGFTAHESGGSTKITSEPSNRPGGLRMAKTCRFQLLIRSTAASRPSCGRARVASSSTVSSGPGVTNLRWR